MAPTESDEQLELYKTRTQQLVDSYKVRIHEAEEMLRRQRRERDIELRELTAQLLFFSFGLFIFCFFNLVSTRHKANNYGQNCCWFNVFFHYFTLFIWIKTYYLFLIFTMNANGFGYDCVAEKSDRIFRQDNEFNKKAWISDRKFNRNEL